MSRTRTYGPVVTTGVCNRTDTLSVQYAGQEEPTVSPVPYSEAFETSYDSRVMTDVVTPKYHVKKARGEIISSPMSRNTVFSVAVPLDLQCSAVYRMSQGHEMIRQIYGQVAPSALGLGTASQPNMVGSAPSVAVPSRDLLLAEVYGRMSSTPFNLMVTAGELGETIDMFRSVLRAVQGRMSARASGYLKRPGSVRLRTLRRFAEDIPGLWLHLRYGIRPFIGELNGLLKALQDQGKRSRERFVAYPKVAYEASSVALSPVTLDHEYFIFQRKCTYRVMATARAGVLAAARMEFLTLEDLLGMGNYVQAAWDLVPYSFVVDWFTNISDVLSAWVPSAWLQPLTDWSIIDLITEEVVQVNPVGCSAKQYNGSWQLQSSEFKTLANGFVKRTTKETVRVVNQRMALTPELNVNLGAAKVADLLALAMQFRAANRR